MCDIESFCVWKWFCLVGVFIFEEFFSLFSILNCLTIQIDFLEGTLKFGSIPYRKNYYTWQLYYMIFCEKFSEKYLRYFQSVST